MLIMPMIDFYATACDWLPRETLPDGLFWFLAISFCNGIVIEIGRKIRAPEDEERGVETYSVLWGRRIATLAWLGAMGVCAICAVFAARHIRFVAPVCVLLAVLIALAAFLGWRFLRHPAPGHGKRFELASGVWTLSMYLSVGVVPLLFRQQP